MNARHLRVGAGKHWEGRHEQCATNKKGENICIERNGYRNMQLQEEYYRKSSSVGYFIIQEIMQIRVHATK